jgi:predicted 3-demethylubiquinone-9 3-methyltransferase (glyoxalase superfamily)
MPKPVPFLWFDGQAEEAAALYTGLFPDSRITGVAHRPPGAPDDQAGEVLTVTFTLDGQDFVGLNGGPQITFSEGVSFQIVCTDQAEVDRYWDGLIADGGSEGPCGWLKDRFGLSWQVVPAMLLELLQDPDRERAGRAFAAMMDMKRLDVARLQRAADGQPA